ncbi:hypothetical protein J4D99_09945 [Siccationidurans ginsengisoli]|uniref:hypothetical protein n=1 Tax=Hymenobacter TaxID=89966 RepID=UPI001AADF445|nr:MULTISPECIES: hypothetical protein [unclassified Hymenobacter]MBO2031707.1 hypothetical protein [Hymenobacter sp. BT559]
MTDTLPERHWLPDRVDAAPASSPAQLAFRHALQEVEELRGQLQRLQASQAAIRQAYWQQVGPVAAAAVAARRALYAPLEAALLSGYLNRAEEQQVTELLVYNARSLQARFGEEETDILARYAPPLPPVEAEPAVGAPLASAEPLPHEQAAAAAQTRRRQQRQQARVAQAKTTAQENEALLVNTKAAYRQLARLHHPDRAAQANAAAQQAQTALMQQITAAYAANDLAALLSLLATAEAAASPSAEAEDLLKRYTEALAQQQAQLSQQLAAARRPEENAPWSGSEKQQRTRLREIKRSLRAETDYLIQLVRHLQEPSSLRQFLRELSASGHEGL